MKKVTILSSLFVVVFGLALGFSMTMNGSASAGDEKCDVNCIYEIYCSSDTGPLCPNPTRPHYAYSINGECPTHPGWPCLEEGAFVGCCR